MDNRQILLVERPDGALTESTTTARHVASTRVR